MASPSPQSDLNSICQAHLFLGPRKTGSSCYLSFLCFTICSLYSIVSSLTVVEPPSMDALSRLHHRHQPPCSSVDRYGLSLPRSISPFLSPPPIPPASPSIRASPSLSPSSSDLPLQNPQNLETLSFQLLDPLIKITSFATVTAASALLFVGFHGNGLINKPMQLSSMGSIKESMEEEIEVEQVLSKDPFHVQSIRHLKLKEKIPIVHDFTKQRPDDKAWKVLKAQVFSCSEELLKDIKLAMERCEKENWDMKYYLTFFNNLLDRIRTLEEDMVGALKYYQELEQ